MSELQREDCAWLQCAWERDKVLCHDPTLLTGPMAQGQGTEWAPGPFGVAMG